MLYEATYAVNKIQVAFGSSFLDCLTCLVFPLFGLSQGEPKLRVVCLLAGVVRAGIYVSSDSFIGFSGFLLVLFGIMQLSRCKYYCPLKLF